MAQEASLCNALNNARLRRQVVQFGRRRFMGFAIATVPLNGLVHSQTEIKNSLADQLESIAPRAVIPQWHHRGGQ
jgi:hypothetical protein